MKRTERKGLSGEAVRGSGRGRSFGIHAALRVGAGLSFVAALAAASPPSAPTGEGAAEPAAEVCCTDSAPPPSRWGEAPGAEPIASPYTGLQARPVKALSAERRAGLLTGAGLGYAMAAELNGHPGPKHVLELASVLELTPEQAAEVTAGFERMRAEAVRLGAAIVAAEEQLDRRFAHRHLDAAALAELTAEIARLEGELRFVHLRAHLETDAVLTAEQRARYAELRGYGEAAAGGASEHVH
jgi:Spy/CpxP family protein refolding chaperone